MDSIYVNQNPTITHTKVNTNTPKSIKHHGQQQQQQSRDKIVLTNEQQTKKVVQNQPSPAPRLQVAATKIPSPGLKFSRQIGIDFFSFLDSVPSLLITQKVDLKEALTAISGENKFAIIDPEGHCRLIASEKSGFCDRLLCGLDRSFRLEIRDTAGNLCLELERGINCSTCCGVVFPDSIQVNLPNGVPLGSIRQRKHIRKSYSIKNSIGETKFLLQGDWFPLHCPGHDHHYDFLEPQLQGGEFGKKQKRINKHNGSLVKKWAGCGKEIFTEAEDFILQFPESTNHNIKALCLASVFFINMRHYEGKAWVPKIAVGFLG